MNCPSYTPVVNKTNKTLFLFIDKCIVCIGDESQEGVLLWGRNNEHSKNFEDRFSTIVISKSDFDDNYTTDARVFSSKFEEVSEPLSLKFLHNAWLKRKCEDSEMNCLY